LEAPDKRIHGQELMLRILAAPIVQVLCIPPVASGNYTFTVTVVNNSGCTTSCAITICVLDVRAGNGKIYLSHINGCNGNNSRCNTVIVSPNAIGAHLHHPCDRLGACTGSQVCALNAKTEGEAEETILEGSEDAEFMIGVYPNPFSDKFRLRISSEETQNLTVKIFDLLGQVIEEKDDVPYNAELYIGNDLSKGVYLLEVTQGDNTQVIRIVKGE
jgi:hypothetical protein